MLWSQTDFEHFQQKKVSHLIQSKICILNVWEQSIINCFPLKSDMARKSSETPSKPIWINFLKGIFERKINCLSSKFYQQNQPTLFSSLIRVCRVRNWKICCNGSFSVSLNWFGVFVFVWFCCLVFLFGFFSQHCLEAAEEEAEEQTAPVKFNSHRCSPILGWRFFLRERPEAAQTHPIFLQYGQSSKSKRGRFHTTAMLDHCRDRDNSQPVSSSQKLAVSLPI